jgi:2-keto-3-deoxy-L-rhamnonate aldolase RhmA
LRTNPVKDKLRSGQLTFGAWITIPNPAVAEIMALAGFDFLVIDTEHGAINIESVQSLIQAMAATAVAPLVRLGGVRGGANGILDTGPCGVIFPMVNSREEAAAVVRVALFPPEGTRGIGLSRAYGFDPGRRDEYVKTANASMLVGIQIEHREAVDRIEEIVTTPGIDLVLLGPADLSGSMGYSSQPEHPEVAKAIENVVHATRRAGVPLGIPVGGPEDVAARVKQGFQFFHLGADIVYLGQSCKNRLREARQAAAEAVSLRQDSQ